MINLDTITNAQFAALLVALAVGAYVIMRFSLWTGRKLVNLFWPVAPQQTAAEIDFDARMRKYYVAQIDAEVAPHEPTHYTDPNRYDPTIFEPKERW